MIAFYVLQRWLERAHLSDVGLYARYARLVRAGEIPYRGFSYVYPPGSLPALLLPAFLPWSYPTSFAVAMGVCGAGCIAAVWAALQSVGASAGRVVVALLLVGGSPFLLGSLFDTRYDLWPTLFAIAATAALLRERPLVSGALIGFGFAAKLWPAVLLPVAAVYLWRRRGRRAAMQAVAAFGVVAAACFLPFLVLAPRGLEESLRFQLVRPLQVESLGAAMLMAAHHFGLTTRLVTASRLTGQFLRGPGTVLAADLSTALEAAAVVAIWVAFTRRQSSDHNSLLLAAAASVAALVAFGKVLSPQYLIWLVPFTALVRGRRGAAAGVLFLVALVLTQTWFPWHYLRLALHYTSPWWWLLLARDLALVGLLVALAWPSRVRDTQLRGHAQRSYALAPARAE